MAFSCQVPSKGLYAQAAEHAKNATSDSAIVLISNSCRVGSGLSCYVWFLFPGQGQFEYTRRWGDPTDERIIGEA